MKYCGDFDKFFSNTGNLVYNLAQFGLLGYAGRNPGIRILYKRGVKSAATG
jgi:hypothetical protein